MLGLERFLNTMNYDFETESTKSEYLSRINNKVQQAFFLIFHPFFSFFIDFSHFS